MPRTDSAGPGIRPAVPRLRLLAVNHTGLVSGGEKVVLRMLAGANARGWETTIAAPEGEIVKQAAEVGTGWLPLPDLMLPGGPLPVAASVFGARNLLAARQIRRAPSPDVVVASGMRVLPLLRAAAPSAPVVWLAQSMIDRPRWRLLVRACAPAVHTAVPVSQAVADTIAPSCMDVKVVANGTRWPIEPAPAEPPTPPVLGCAAILSPWKGQDVLLEAVARLERTDVVVELMGRCYPKDGAYAASLRRRAEQPDLVGRVRFLGHVEDPVARMRTWTASVVASVEPEAGPLSAIEAMSIGIPVVATNHGGPREVIGDAGILVRRRDPDAMAAGIRAILEEDDLRRSCAQAGPRIVASRYRLDRQIDALLDVVAGTVGARAR
jgi:glycosyltransferase involved in cell wall biosynthesis